jgi:sporulation protein YlmC with PRC-barrel domain
MQVSATGNEPRETSGSAWTTDIAKGAVMAGTIAPDGGWIGRTVYDRQGEKVGKITDVYYDDRTGRPEWLTVSTGWFGTKEQVVPIAGSAADGDDIRVRYDADLIREAPAVEAGDAHLSVEEERRLYEHYGFDPDAANAALIYGDQERADEGYDFSGWSIESAPSGEAGGRRLRRGQWADPQRR